MSGERILNKQAYDSFKADIPYQALKQSIDTSLSVRTDWPELLSSLSYSGVTCSMDSMSVDADNYIGRLSGNLICGDQEISIEVEVLNKNNYDSLERSILLLSRTMRTDIYYKYLQGMPGNVYFASKGDNEKQSGVFVYHNVIVQLNHMEDEGDVIPVAKALVGAMSNQLVATNDAISTANIRPPPEYRAKIGENISIEVVPIDKNIVTDVVIADLPSEIKYVSSTGHSYVFSALKVGSAHIPVIAYNPRTLLSSMHNILVTVGN